MSSGKSAKQVLKNCVKEMTLSTISEHAFLILRGGCADEGKFFVGSVYLLTGELPLQSLLPDEFLEHCQRVALR